MAIVSLLASPEYLRKYPGGASARQIREQLRDEFPYCSWQDVYDELHYIYGEPK